MIVPPQVLDLVRRPATLPAYVYDLGALDAHAAAIRAALPRAVEFYYAVKANPDAGVLRALARHTMGSRSPPVASSSTRPRLPLTARWRSAVPARPRTSLAPR